MSAYSILSAKRTLTALALAGLGTSAMAAEQAEWIQQQLAISDGHIPVLATPDTGAAGRAADPDAEARFAFTLEQLKMTDGYAPVSAEATGAAGRAAEPGEPLSSFVEEQLRLTDGSH